MKSRIKQLAHIAGAVIVIAGPPLPAGAPFTSSASTILAMATTCSFLSS